MNKLNICLTNKKCQPCQGGIPPLSSEDVERLLEELGEKWAPIQQAIYIRNMILVTYGADESSQQNCRIG